MGVDINATYNRMLADEINDQMTKAVMPVTVFVGVEVVLGFFGNLVVFYVFLFRYHTCNFRYFVLSLAITDITSTLTTMPGEIVTQHYWYVYPVPLVCKIKSFFNVFTVSSEALCLLTIAVDRYLKVCRPFGWQVRPRLARWLCVLIFAISFVIAFPVAIYWGTHEENYVYKGLNVTVTVCEKDQKFVDTSNPLQYSVTIDVLISVSLVLMLLLYILIAKTILVRKFGNEIEEDGAKRNISNQHDRSTTETTELQNRGAGETASKTTVPSDNPVSGTCLTSDSEPSPVKRRTENTKDSDTMRTTTLNRQSINTKVRRKTMIMFILTITFIVTTSMYLALLSFIAHGVLTDLSDNERAVYFFFFRFYFINHVINPFVYGVLDPKFRKVMLTCKNFVASSFTASSNT